MQAVLLKKTGAFQIGITFAENKNSNIHKQKRNYHEKLSCSIIGWVAFPEFLLKHSGNV